MSRSSPSPSLVRQRAYDAAYIALAQSLDADLWTVDGPLARNARSVGLPVQLLGPHSAPPILS
jgi:predicted nucleic acid-binding protein